MLELQNFFKMKDFFAENFGNFWKKVVLRKILGTFVFGKILLSGKIFFGGPWNGRGPNFGIHPPTGNRLARPCKKPHFHKLFQFTVKVSRYDAIR
jgi:hypothetical protein